MVERRREQVTREEFNELVREVKENTEVTHQVRDILVSMKVMMHIGKWVAAIAGAVAAVLAMVKGIRG